MVAHGEVYDPETGTRRPVVTSPVAKRRVRDSDGNERTVIIDPHIGSRYKVKPQAPTPPTVHVRGGTTNPSEGETGDVMYWDEDGNVLSQGPSVQDTPLPGGVNSRPESERAGAWTEDDPAIVQQMRAMRTTDRARDAAAGEGKAGEQPPQRDQDATQPGSQGQAQTPHGSPSREEFERQRAQERAQNDG